METGSFYFAGESFYFAFDNPMYNSYRKTVVFTPSPLIILIMDAKEQPKNQMEK